VQYTYRYDNTSNSRLRKTRWFEGSIKESGNIVSGAMMLAGKSFSTENKKLFGSPYSQFLKATLELRNGYRLSQKSSLATRFQAGAIWTYGNSSVAPYSELFYVGGANSIRAFGVRSIGPGGYHDYEGRGTYLDQAGDLKLEANVEYRFNLLGDLHGALFLDAGNVWNLRSDDSHPHGKFELSDFFNQLALGTGFGLRYDLQFLVLRLDLGIGIHAPYDTGKSGYYNIPKFWDGVGFHFAIGYPF
jgi:outer membrane protein assembly factor BamA